MKRIVAMIIFLTVVFTGCGSKTVAINQEKPKILRILYHQGYNVNTEMTNGIAAMRYVGRLYEEKTGIEIVCEELEANTISEFSQKLSSMILEGDAPDMFILTNTDESLDLNDLIKGDVIEDLSDKLTNYNGLIEGTKNGYYFPCAYMSWGINLQIEELERLGMGDLESVIDQKHFKEIYIKWLESRKPEINRIHYNQLMRFMFTELEDYIDFEEDYRLTDPGAREIIKTYANYISSRVYFDIKTGLNTDTLAKQLFDTRSNHFRDSMQRHADNSDTYIMKERYGWFNQLSTKGLKRTFEEKNVPYAAPGEYFVISGLVVNKASKNKHYAIDYIDYMISESIQNQVGEKYNMSSSAANGLVNKNAMLKQIEGETYVYDEKIMKVKESAFKIIESGQSEIVSMNREAKNKYHSELYKIVFDYGYGIIETEDELVNRLRKLSSEIFMMVHE